MLINIKTFSALILVLMEACGERIKRHPCYYCATLFIYESLCILSLFAYFSALLSMNHIDQWIGFVRRTPYAILFLICAGIFYCSQWLRYTSEHMMLSWCKITGVCKIYKIGTTILPKISVDLRFLFTCFSPSLNT